MKLSDPVKYGLVVFAAIFAVGFLTGMGGSFLPNLGFSALMGVLAKYLALIFLAMRTSSLMVSSRLRAKRMRGPRKSHLDSTSSSRQSPRM